jgi:hypothetical protein
LSTYEVDLGKVWVIFSGGWVVGSEDADAADGISGGGYPGGSWGQLDSGGEFSISRGSGISGEEGAGEVIGVEVELSAVPGLI